MDWITTSGTSIDEAKSNALDQLGIVADEAEFDIVNDVEKGLFGRIKSEAKVRARVKPKAPAVKDERRRRGAGKGESSGKSRSRGGRGGGRNGGSRGGGGRDSSRGQQAQKKQQRQNKPQSQQSKAPERAKTESGGEDRQERARAARAARTAGDGERGDDRSRDTKSGTTSSDTRSRTKSKKDNVDHEFSRNDQEKVAIDFLEGIVDVLDMEGAVALAEGEAEDGAIELAVTGDGLGLLVGPKGATLNALQELTRSVVQREAQGARTERLRVDVAGYRERRTAALQEFARGIADDVLDSGSEKVLEPMGPADRKVVHDAIGELDGVETGSEGEEPRRRVVIRPTG